MKFPVKFLIGILAIIIGISGVLVCVCTQHSSEEGIIADYISAINDGDTEAMMQYAPSYYNMFNSNYNVEETDPIKAALANSCFSVPGDAQKVNSVELIGCELANEVTTELYMQVTGSVVDVLIKIEYVDAAEETQSVIREKTVTIIEQNGDYIIMPNS